MSRRVLAIILLGLALMVCVVFAASESLTNRTGKTATAVTITFSEEVRITSYDETVFPTKEPSSRAQTFKFSGGQLENGARFSVSWTPSGATIESHEWATEPDLSGPIEVGAVWDQRRVDRINRVLRELDRIPVGDFEGYYYAAQDEGGLCAEDVFAALTDLAVLTLGVENDIATVNDPATGLQESMVGGEFRQLVSNMLFGDQPTDLILVFNTGTKTFRPEGGAADEIYYSYELLLGRKYFIRAYLSPGYARAGGGCDVGVYFVDRQQVIDVPSPPRKILCHELVFKHPNPADYPDMDPSKWISTLMRFTRLASVAEDGILELEGWLFEEGNPSWIGYRPVGPP